MPAPDFPFAHAGQMGRRISRHDWPATAFGAIDRWSPTLRTTLGLCLHSTVPTAIYWGDEHRLLYNDAWLPMLDGRHPWSLGRPARQVWPEGWDEFAPHVARLRERCEGVEICGAPSPLGPEDGSRWDFSLSPIVEPDGSIAGVLGQAQDASARIGATVRDTLIAALAESLGEGRTATAMLARALPQIGAALGTGRIAFAEIDRKRGLALIEGCWTDGRQADLAGVHALDRFAALAGIAGGDPAVGRPDPMRAQLCVPIVAQHRIVAMLLADDPEPRGWTAQREGLAREAADLLWRSITRARAEAAMRNGDARHRLIFEQTDAILFSADRTGRLTACNPAAARAFGEPAAALVMRPLATLIADDGYAWLATALDSARDTARPASAEISVGGGPRRRDWLITATPATDIGGTDSGFHAVARDVTADRAAERRQRVLINELNHRVKNTLALVQGLALQTFRDGRELGASRTAFQGRLGALAGAHDLLTQAHWEGATIAAIASGAAAAHDGRISVAGPALTVSPKAAISLALAFHELAANAVAYGALSVPDGRVEIDWAVADDRLRLHWRESGGPPPVAPARRSYGLRMIERVLATDFRGTVDIRFEAGGLSCLLDAPVPVPAEGGFPA